jgi:hypothetical protein
MCDVGTLWVIFDIEKCGLIGNKVKGLRIKKQKPSPENYSLYTSSCQYFLSFNLSSIDTP